MGRPAKFSRDEAITTIMNEVWERGYEACSTRAISDKLGITRSSLYNAFGNRENLFLEIINFYNGSEPDRGWFPIKETGSVLKVISQEIRNICRIRINNAPAKGCLVINSITELVGRDEILGPALAEVFSTNIEYLEKVLTVAAERGEIEKSELRIKALALQSVLVGLNVMSKVVRDEEELWAATRHSLSALGLYRD
jgi:TetR/AcrR family transcriptional repressor of nem operon